MSTYALSGSGTQALSAGVGALHVHFTTLDPNNGAGNAYPSNIYHAALLRAGDGTGWFAALPVDAVDSWVPLPIGTTELAYAFQNTNAADVAEVFGPSPLAGGASPLTTKGDLHGFSTVDDRLGVGSDGSVLVAASGEATGLKWDVAPAFGGFTTASSEPTGEIACNTGGTFVDVCSLSLAAGTWLVSGLAHGDTTNGSNSIFARILAGATELVRSHTPAYFIGIASVSVPMVFVALGSTTTVKLQGAWATSATNQIRHSWYYDHSVLHVTMLNAIKVA